MAPTEREHVLVAVLFTDIVGSTELAARMGDESWKRLLHKHHEIVGHLVKEHGGRVVDTAGDGVFAVFDRPAAGIQCAFDAIQALRTIGVDIRAGLHFGESESSDGKVSGIVVHTASRVMALASPGEILITGTVRDLIAGKRISVGDRGMHDLKGIPSAWNVFAVEEVEGRRTPPPMEPDDAEELRQRTAQASPRARPKWFAAAAIAGLLVLAGAAFLLSGDEHNREGSPPRPISLLYVDLETEQRSQVAVGDTVTAITLGEGSVWLASYGDSTVYRLDPHTMSIQRRIPLPEPPQEIIVGAGWVWVTTSRKLIRIDPSSNSIDRDFPLFPCDAAEICQTDVTLVGGGVWATHYEGQRLVQIDPTRDDMRRVIPLTYPMALATGRGAVWALLDAAPSPIIERFDLATGRISSETLPRQFISPACVGYGRIAFPGELCAAIGVGDRSVWVAIPGELNSELWQLDPLTGVRLNGLTSLPCCVMAIAPEAGIVPTIWTGLSGGELITIAEVSAHPEERGVVGGIVTDVAVGYGGVWVSVDERGPDAS